MNTITTPLDLTARPLPCLVPEGRDALDNLTVGELGTVGRQIGADPYEATQKGAPARWETFARIAWLWAKRLDPKAKLAPFLDIEIDAVVTLLGIGGNPEDYAADEPDPEHVCVDECTDDRHVVEATPLVDELAGNPTAPTPESPSLERGDYTPTPS